MNWKHAKFSWNIAGSNPLPKGIGEVSFQFFSEAEFFFIGECRMSRISLTKQELYEIYQSNIKMCEVQIEMVKRTANQIIGELYWHKQKNSKNSRINNWEIELKAAQRLYIF